MTDGYSSRLTCVWCVVVRRHMCAFRWTLSVACAFWSLQMFGRSPPCMLRRENLWSDSDIGPCSTRWAHLGVPSGLFARPARIIKMISPRACVCTGEEPPDGGDLKAARTHRGQAGERPSPHARTRSLFPALAVTKQPCHHTLHEAPGHALALPAS